MNEIRQCPHGGCLGRCSGLDDCPNAVSQETETLTFGSGESYYSLHSFLFSSSAGDSFLPDDPLDSISNLLLFHLGVK